MSKTFKTEPAVAVLRAVEEMGVPAVAEAFGVHPSSIYNIAKSGECRPAFNLAAKTLLKKPTQSRLLICRVPEGTDTATARKLLAALGIKSMEFTE